MRPPVDRWVQGNDSGTYTSTVDKFLIHTTEGGSIDGAIAAYRANNSWPHLTVDCRIGRPYVRCGHLDLDVPSRSLRNEAGGVQTNRDGVIQVEVVGSATRPSEIDWVWFGKHVLGPCCRLKGIPLTSTVPWVPYPASYGENAAQRLSAASWTAYRGVLGHQHCPENSHGDPGAIPIVTILAGAAGGTPIPEEDDMALDADDKQYIRDEVRAAALTFAQWLTADRGSTIFDPAKQTWMESAVNLPRLANVVGLDEAAVAAAVLAGLDPAAIAAAIPTELADQVADELAARLAG